PALRRLPRGAALAPTARLPRTGAPAPPARAAPRGHHYLRQRWRGSRLTGSRPAADPPLQAPAAPGRGGTAMLAVDAAFRDLRAARRAAVLWQGHGRPAG